MNITYEINTSYCHFKLKKLFTKLKLTSAN